MSSYLNPYQTAILQEMGICVWQSQSALNDVAVTNNTKPEVAAVSPANQSREAVNTSTGVAPTAANGQARIAQLRSMLGNKDEKKGVKAPTPAAEPIDPRSFGQMGRDILLALSLFHDVKAIRWQHGTELSLKDNVLTLPYKTAPTHAADKRRLWKVISAN